LQGSRTPTTEMGHRDTNRVMNEVTAQALGMVNRVSRYITSSSEVLDCPGPITEVFRGQSTGKKISLPINEYSVRVE